MKLVKASYKIESPINGIKILKAIEKAGRTCYRSENKITKESCIEFAQMIINKKHETVLEHEKITIRFIFDTGVSHQKVRHRLSSFSQESTRWCNYAKGIFKKNGIQFIQIKHHLKNPKITYNIWLKHMEASENAYFAMIEAGEKPEIARSVLPKSLKTEMVVTANLRQWRHVLKERIDKTAHPQMREVMIPLLQKLKNKIPVVFDDIIEEV